MLDNFRKKEDLLTDEMRKMRRENDTWVVQ